jgi:single-strand DNA-binding protein
MNQVNIIGNIGTEPEVRSFNSGKKVMRFSLAVNGYSKDGKARPTTWIPCETWDETAERFSKCAEKGKLSGRKVQITGSLALNEYDRTVGDTSIKERKLYVKVHQFTLLSRSQEAEEAPMMVAEEAPAPNTKEPKKSRRSRT